jgi:hypothetical protein
MKCTECPWHWQDEGEEYPSCKYHYDDGYAPCEIEERERETEDVDDG